MATSTRPSATYRQYEPEAVIELFGKKVHILDMTREFSETMPHYPGHAKTAFWWHLTHAECLMRLSDPGEFKGYGVRAIATCEHVSTHVDAIYHFNPDRPDLTIDVMPLEYMITPAAWIDVSDVPPRSHITLPRIRRALDEAGVTLKPGMTLLYYTGVAEHWDDHARFVSQYPGLDGEATDWLLDQGLVNVATDAVSTDNPADQTYPNHLRHGQRLVHHTENVANINRIPRHQDFYWAMFPWRIVGGTGSPIRAITMWAEDEA